MLLLTTADAPPSPRPAPPPRHLADDGYDSVEAALYGGYDGCGSGGSGGGPRRQSTESALYGGRPSTAPAAGVSPLGLGGGLHGGGYEEDELERQLARTPRDSSGMLQILEGLTGGDPAAEIPLAMLSTICRHVGVISKRRVPKLVAQKRNFVRGWHTDMRSQLGIGVEGAGSGRAPALGEGALFDELERIFAEQNLRVTSRSSELPNHLIDRLADQIARLSGGAEPPTLLQERRELVYSWHRKETLRRRPPPANAPSAGTPVRKRSPGYGSGRCFSTCK